MKLVEDLGMLPISENSKYKARFGIYECTECKEHFKSNSSKVKTRNIKLCPRCAKDGRHRKTHGDTGTRLHNIWKNMKARCYNKHNPSYKDYGAKGVVICEEWLNNYSNFKAWADSHNYSDKLSIDRIDPAGNYEPSNCRWANNSTQTANQRPRIKSNGLCTGIHPHNRKFKVMITVEGEINYLGLFDTLEEAVTTRNTFIINNSLPHTIVNIAILKEQYVP
jgi:hypothetical protein